MRKTKWLKLMLVILLASVMMLGYGGLCSKKSSDKDVVVSSSGSSGGSDTIAPTVPTGLIASAVSSSQINLTWNASSDAVGVTGYNVYRNGTQVGTPFNTSYNDTGLLPLTPYTYAVAAYDAAGNTSAQSYQASDTTQAPPGTIPNPPSSLVTNAVSSSQINLSWTDASGNEDGFRIERSLTSGSGFSEITTVGVNVTNYSDIGIAASTTYYYRVKAYNSVGISSSSNEARGDGSVVQPTVTTQAPTDVGQTSATGNGNITDTGGQNCTERGFKYGLTQTDTWSVSDTGSFGTGAYTKTITGLTAGITYCIRAFATNSAGTGYGSWTSFAAGTSEEEFFLGLNFLSAEEYAAIPLGSPSGGAGDLPTEWDISSKMPIPGDQKTQQSCTAWAVAYALKTYQEGLERNWSLSESNHLFSPSYIYNQINIGRLAETDSGASIRDALDLLKSQGCATLATMPYNVNDNVNDFLTQPSAEARTEAAKYKVLDYGRVLYSSRAEVKKWLYSNTPLPISIWIGTNFSNTNMKNNNYIYKSLGDKIPLNKERTEFGYGGHAVTLVGYDDSKSAFKIINSWGTTNTDGTAKWGDYGYGWIDYDFFPQVCKEAYWVKDDTTGVPEIEVTPSSLSFGDISIGTTKDLSFTVKNIGTGILEGSASGLSEPFSFVVMPEYYLGAEQSTTVKVRFAPITAGDSSQIVNFTGGIGSSNGVNGSGMDETVSTPNQPTGSTEGIPNTSYTYSAGGASSSLGHSVQYQFDWGDGTTSSWGSATQSKSWSSGGTYTVKAWAHCATHTSIESGWSSGLTVKIETVSTPNKPSGATEGSPYTSYSYSTGGASSNLGHSLQYRFDWGDGTTSSWGSATQSKSWSLSGTYTVKAQAWCSTHTSVVSNWSSGLTVYIETVSAPYVSSGEKGGFTSTSYNYSASGASSSLGHSMQYQFDWGDGTTSSWGSATQTKFWSTASNSNTYSVKVRARCSTHTSIISGWSSTGYAVRIISGATATRTATDRDLSLRLECPVAAYRGRASTITWNATVSNYQSVEYALSVGQMYVRIYEYDSTSLNDTIREYYYTPPSPSTLSDPNTWVKSGSIAAYISSYDLGSEAQICLGAYYDRSWTIGDLNTNTESNLLRVTLYDVP